ncbi:MAG: fibrobacter succinogenes major paralogous domain-containing protein [Fibrobacter sp.]|nr:fibrobacter succinogenes major paralogous domain-containing protein [Fibrobacter sp.]
MFALISSIFVACSNSEVAGGSSDDAGIIADLNVAGVSQKGPFVKGSAVTVQGIDCKTMELTGERFDGVVKSDKGDFEVNNVNLSSTCAVFEVTGFYLNEISGQKTNGELTLRALTDLTDRKNVNINLLTHLEYERIKHLVTEKKLSFAEAKTQAEREVLASFDISNEVEGFENLNIFESGDGNAALLAVSVLMQADADVAKLEERTNEFSAAIATNGSWDNEEAKTEIADWVRDAEASGKIEMIRKNVENWNESNKVSAFEKYVESFGEGLSRDSYLNPVTPYDSIVDNRDGQIYKTVKIGEQVWMAQNLNYIDTAKAIFKDSSWCYDNNPRNCALAGRLYTWTVAKDSLCPEGYHLPDTTEWNTLFASVGGTANAGTVLRSILGWDSVDGTNDYGFSAVAVGERYHSGSFDSEGTKAFIWTATALPEESENSAYAAYFVENATVSFKKNFKDNGASVRCLKDTF